MNATETKLTLPSGVLLGALARAVARDLPGWTASMVAPSGNDWLVLLERPVTPNPDGAVALMQYETRWGYIYVTNHTNYRVAFREDTHD